MYILQTKKEKHTKYRGLIERITCKQCLFLLLVAAFYQDRLNVMAELVVYNTGTRWQVDVLRKPCSADCFKVTGRDPEGQI